MMRSTDKRLIDLEERIHELESRLYARIAPNEPYPRKIFARIYAKNGLAYSFKEQMPLEANPSDGAQWEDREGGIDDVCYEINGNGPNWHVPGSLIVELVRLRVKRDDGTLLWQWFIDRGLPNPLEGPRHIINPSSQCG